MDVTDMMSSSLFFRFAKMAYVVSLFSVDAVSVVSVLC